MGNIGVDVSKEELASQYRDALRIIDEQRQMIEKLQDSVVELWHASGSSHVGSLWKCLCMTYDEYAKWIMSGMEN